MPITPFTSKWPAMELAYPTRLGRLLEQMFDVPMSRDQELLFGNWVPPVDVIEEKDLLKITAELPGVKPEDVKIQLENNLLTIRGEKRKVEETKDETSHKVERVYGTFERYFTLPASIDAEHIKATFEGGVLMVTLPKVEAAKPRQISVKVEKP
jgi:HSP20 family protein